jgi:hypothetical protein
MRFPTPVAKYRNIFFGLAAAFNLALLLAYWFRPTIEVGFSPGRINFEQGNLYTYPLGNFKSFLYDFSGDNDHGGGNQSSLELLENGKSLGSGHHPHRKIAELGQGRFAHWENAVYFSSSDGSDPRTNGYSYAARYRAHMKGGIRVWTVSLLLLVTAAFLLVGPTLVARTRKLLSSASPRRSVWNFTLPQYARRSLLLGTISLNALLLVAHIYRPMVEFTLNPEHISLESGDAYIYNLGKLIGFPYVLRGDSISGNTQSSLQLFENEKILGPAHAVHDEIRAKGRGRFSHWENAIVFSSFDNSSPITNTHTYTARGISSLNPVLWVPSSIFLILSIVLALNQKIFGIATFLLLPNPRAASNRYAPPIFLLAALGVACACLFHKWNTGETLSLGVSGFLPVSDAHGYWQCATWIEKGGSDLFAENTFMRDWCSRRLIYPSFLSGLLRLTAWSLPGTLLLQAGIIAIAIAALSLLATARLSIASALLTAYLLFDFANIHAIGVLMTEVTGLIGGTAAAVFLILAIETGCMKWLFSGLALFSIAMVSRAGAMFVLPFLLAWSIWFVCRVRNRNSKALISGCLASLTAGMVLQKFLTQVLGLNAQTSFGNFSTVLYRLSAGKNNWGAAYTDYPELFQNLTESEAFKRLYKIALDNIRTHPDILIDTYFQEGQRYLGVLLNFDHQGGGLPCFLVLILIGTIKCLLQRGSPLHSLLLVTLAGEIVSAPILYADGYARVFAATIPFRTLMAGVGIVTVWEFFYALAVPLRFMERKVTGVVVASQTTTTAMLGAFSGGMVPIASLLPFTGLLFYSEVKPVPAIPCEAPAKAAVIRLDRESIAFSIVDGISNNPVVPFQITKEKLKDGLLQDNTTPSWFTDDFLALSSSSIIVQGINLSRSAGFRFMQPIDLLWHGPHPQAGSTVSICVDTGKHTDIAGAPYFEITKFQGLHNASSPIR